MLDDHDNALALDACTLIDRARTLATRAFEMVAHDNTCSLDACTLINCGMSTIIGRRAFLIGSCILLASRFSQAWENLHLHDCASGRKIDRPSSCSDRLRRNCYADSPMPQKTSHLACACITCIGNMSAIVQFDSAIDNCTSARG